jgi:hypothetical protein
LDWDGGDVEVAHCDDQTTTYTDDFRRRMGLPIVKLREAGISQRQQEKKHRGALSPGARADKARFFAKQRQQKRGNR